MSDAFELEICQGKYRYRYEAGKQEVWRNGDIWPTMNGKLIGDKFVFSLAVELDEALKECDALRAKIEAMERQEPVAWYSKQYGFVYMSRHSSQFEHGSILYLRNGTPAWRVEGSSRVALLNMASLPHGTVFYALPGAKGEEK